MHTRTVCLALIISFILPVGFAVAGNPIPGIGFVVKRPPGSSTAMVVPGGFFGPGSEPFTGGVGLEGTCSHACGGCDDNCAGRENDPDGRIDYAADLGTGPFDVIMQAKVLYSTEPILVRINGVDSFFDVFVTIRGQGPLPDEPIPGTLLLPPGQSLDTGTSSLVLDSFFDIHCTMTFADASTGLPAGSAIEQDLHMELQDAGLPITRVADGTPEGYIVLGKGASNTVPFTYASAGGELVLKMLSLTELATVSAEEKSWGALKNDYR